jgi:hypothetical protein
MTSDIFGGRYDKLDALDPNDPDIDSAYERRHVRGVAIAEAQRDNWERLQAEMSANPPPFIPLTPEEEDNIDEEIAKTLQSMAYSRHHKWGFLIYRTTYDDDEAWRRFMRGLKWAVHESIAKGFDRVAPFLQWTVVEDRSVLDGASKDIVREHFRGWVVSRTVERDGPGAKRKTLPRRSPRYRYCLYVDKKTVDEAKVDISTKYGTEPFVEVQSDVIVLDSFHGTPEKPRLSDNPYEGMDPSEMDEEDLEDMLDVQASLEDRGGGGCEPVEGNIEYDVGWMLVPAPFLAVTYGELGDEHAEDPWEEVYVRPPKRGPGPET